MELDELRHFLAIVESGSLTAASLRAHLSQPALSQSLRRLEESVGATLLHRGRQGARLTASGDAFVPHARLALAALEDGRRAAREVAGLQRGEVRIGAGSTACTYLLPPTLVAFRAAWPGVAVFLREASNLQLWEALDGGALDLALLTDMEPSHHPGLQVEPCLTDELVVISAPGLDQRSLDWVAFPRDSAVRALQDRHFPGARVVMELNSIAAVKGNVRAGIGRALVSRAALTRDLHEGSLVIVETEGTPIRRELVLARREPLPPAAQRLRTMLLGPGYGGARRP
jgi:DNA-binding transcriptional LysR family regulator